MTGTIDRLESFTDPVQFEQFCAELLANYGDYDGLVPQGVGRRDGGKDAIRRILGSRRKEAEDAQSVSWLTEGQVFHFSLRKDVAAKVREDLINTQKHGLDPQLVVFVTNRRCTPGQQDTLKADCRTQYGWTLEILDQEWLRLPLDGAWQSVRRRYLGIDYDQTRFHRLDDLLEQRQRHPNKWDLEAGAYFRRERLHDALAEGLDRHRIALIIAPPGHGKTALARTFGWEWCRQDTRRELFYLSVQQDKGFHVWEQAVHAFDQPHACYVIDDAHLNVDAVTSFVAIRHRFSYARLIVISRPLEPSSRGDLPDSYFEDLAEQTLHIEAEPDDWLQIARAMIRRPELGTAELGDPTNLLARCAGDLHLLQHLMQAWEDLPEPRPTLADVPEGAVDQAVVRRYLGARDKPQEAMLALAALGQYEIAADSAWLRPLPGFDRLLADGWADCLTERIYGQPRELIAFFHSTPARQLVESAYRLGRLPASATSSQVFSLDRLRSYLESDALNAVDAVYDLYRNGGEALQGLVLDPGRASALLDRLPLDRWDGLADATMLVHAIWRQEGSPEHGVAHALWPRVRAAIAHQVPKLSEARGASSVLTFLFFANRFEPKIYQSVLSRTGAQALGQTCRTANLGRVSIFLNNANRAGVDKADLRAFCTGLDFADLGHRSQGNSLVNVSTFLATASRAGVDKADLRAFCTDLDFADLGRRSQGNGLVKVSIFLDMASRAGVDKADLRAFCTDLDFSDLGHRSKGVGLSTVKSFLDTASRAGVDKANLRAFCAGLDFGNLGHRSRGNSLATVSMFLNTASRAGVDKADLRAFCTDLDFGDLGHRSKGVGLSTVRSFLDTASRAGVDKADLRAFCTGLDFGDLGICSHHASLNYISDFMQRVSLAGISPQSLKNFAAGLNFLALGRQMRPDDSGERKAPLLPLLWASRNRGITRRQAREFIRGWGWTDIRQAVGTYFSPDCLFVLLDFLLRRCGYSESELAPYELHPRSPALWIRAFTEHPVGTGVGFSKMQRRPLADAADAFQASVTPTIWKAFDLRHWNILSHNLRLADPDLLESLLWPALVSLPRHHRDRLLADADLYNLSVFLSKFGPDREFSGRQLPARLPDAHSLIAKISTATARESTFLLLNLWWVDAADQAVAVIESWSKNANSLPNDLADADLRTLSFVLWTAWLAAPDGSWTASGALADALNKRLSVIDQNKGSEVLDWLSVAGVFVLSNLPIPRLHSIRAIGVAETEKKLRGTFTSKDSELIRRLAGALGLFGNELSPGFRRNAAAALALLPSRPEIPPQEEAKGHVHSLLLAIDDSGLTSRRPQLRKC